MLHTIITLLFLPFCAAINDFKERSIALMIFHFKVTQKVNYLFIVIILMHKMLHKTINDNCDKKEIIIVT